MRKIANTLYAMAALVALAGCTAESGEASDEQLAQSEETQTHGDGIVIRQSAQSVEDTMDALEAAVEENGLTVFARVDHRANAAGADLEMPPTMVLIFGNPQLGTPLMRAAPDVSLDLPQRIAVYEDSEGAVQIAYNDPAWLAARHGITGHDEIVTQISGALNNLTDRAAQ